MTTKKTGAKASRSAPPDSPDRKTLAAGEPPAGTATTSNSTRRAWKKKSVAEHILGQLDKLREEVKEKEQAYLIDKQQLDKLEALREVLENQ